MRALMLGALAAAVLLGPASAQEAPPVTTAAKDAVVRTPAARKLYICGQDQLTRRGFAREHGVLEFVRAEQAAKPDKAWTTPKCIRASELQRLQRLQLAQR